MNQHDLNNLKMSIVSTILLSIMDDPYLALSWDAMTDLQKSEYLRNLNNGINKTLEKLGK